MIVFEWFFGMHNHLKKTVLSKTAVSLFRDNHVKSNLEPSSNIMKNTKEAYTGN